VIGGKDLGCDGGQLVDLPLGQHGEEVFVEVLQVSILSGSILLEPLRGEGHRDRAFVGVIGGSSNEPAVFEAAHDARDPALAKWRAAAEFGHRHRVIRGEDGEEEQHLVFVERDTVPVLEGPVEGTEHGVTGADESKERPGIFRTQVLGSVAVDGHPDLGRLKAAGSRGRIVHAGRLPELACVRIDSVCLRIYIVSLSTRRGLIDPERKAALMKSAIARQGGIGLIVALVLVAITYVAADAASGPLLVTQPGGDTPEAIPMGFALGFTVLGGAVGIGLAFLANRTGRPRITFVVVAAVALVLYGIMPFAAAEEASTAIWLNAMHLAAALPIVGLLARSLPDRRASLAAAAESQALA